MNEWELQLNEIFHHQRDFHSEAFILMWIKIFYVQCWRFNDQGANVQRISTIVGWPSSSSSSSCSLIWPLLLRERIIQVHNYQFLSIDVFFWLHRLLQWCLQSSFTSALSFSLSLSQKPLVNGSNVALMISLLACQPV